MTEQEVEIDRIRGEFDLVNGFMARVMTLNRMRELGATDEEIDAMLHHRSQTDGIFAELKSLITDGERLDFIEKQARPMHTMEERSKWVQLRWDQSKTLRQAIDERRKP